MSRSVLLFAIGLMACVPSEDDTSDLGDCSSGAVVTFDDIADTSEGATWEEDGVTLTLLANDQGGFNARFDEPTGCLWLYIGTRLRAETTCGPSIAEIDTIDYCGGGCANAAAFEGGVEIASTSSAPGTNPQTLVLDGGVFDQVDVVGLETPVCEMRFD